MLVHHWPNVSHFLEEIPSTSEGSVVLATQHEDGTDAGKEITAQAQHDLNSCNFFWVRSVQPWRTHDVAVVSGNSSKDCPHSDWLDTVRTQESFDEFRLAASGVAKHKDSVSAAFSRGNILKTSFYQPQETLDIESEYAYDMSLHNFFELYKEVAHF